MVIQSIAGSNFRSIIDYQLYHAIFVKNGRKFEKSQITAYLSKLQIIGAKMKEIEQSTRRLSRISKLVRF